MFGRKYTFFCIKQFYGKNLLLCLCYSKTLQYSRTISSNNLCQTAPFGYCFKLNQLPYSDKLSKLQRTIRMTLWDDHNISIGCYYFNVVLFPHVRSGMSITNCGVLYGFKVGVNRYQYHNKIPMMRAVCSSHWNNLQHNIQQYKCTKKWLMCSCMVCVPIIHWTRINNFETLFFYFLCVFFFSLIYSI